MYILWCIILKIIVINCQDDVKDKPDITLLSIINDDLINHTCAAGSNIDNSAIGFITPFRQYPSNPVSSYVNQGIPYNEDNYDCDFENLDKCPDGWVFNFKIKSSLEQNVILDPVIDKRWEKFATFSENIPAVDISKKEFNIGLSVRAKLEASIFLCGEDPKKCYWLILNEVVGNKYEQILRLCNLVYTGNFKEEEAGCTKRIVSGIVTKLPKNKWIHLFLSISANNFTLTRYDDKKSMATTYYDIDPEFGSIKNMHLHLKNGSGFWKSHQYSYLSLNEDIAPGDLTNIGPTFQVDNNEICLELYAATCEKCSMSFGFNGQEVQEIPIDFKRRWYHMRLTRTVETSKAQLQIKAACKDCSNSEGFWFIDDIRRCHVNESRIINISARNKDEISCIALKHPQWKVSNKGGAGINKICSNPSYIGSNCDISCSSIFGSIKEYCNKYSICVPTQGSSTSCTCAAGYYGENCTEPCQQGFHGYNCVEVCKPCRNACLKSSGVCTEECNSNDDTKYCNISELLQILKPPIINDATLTTITVTPNVGNLPNSNQKYQIEYKHDNMPWEPYGNIGEVSNIKTITMSNLTPLTKYYIRTVLSTEDGKHSTANINHIYSTTETKCLNVTETTKFYGNLVISPESTKVTIQWTPICNGVIKFRFSSKYNNSLSYCHPMEEEYRLSIIEAKAVVPNFNPNTEYKLNVSVFNSNMEEINYELKEFRTPKSELPILKTPPTIISTSLYEIKIKFRRSDITNAEKVQYFVVQIKSLTLQWTDKIVQNIKGKIEPEYTITIGDLEKDMEYKIRVIFRTEKGEYLRDCIPFVSAETVCKDLSKHNLIKDLVITPYQTYLELSWKAVCRNKFNIIMECAGDSWCTENGTNIIVKSVEEIHKIYRLKPYTYYHIKFSVADSQVNQMRSITLRTKPAAPLAVSELKVYSFSSDGISIRFKNPYPPYGELEDYRLNIQSCGDNGFFSARWQNCELWEGYQCITISQDHYTNCFKYIIYIEAKNKDVQILGPRKSVTLLPDAVTEPPNYLSVHGDQICLDHPDFVNGILRNFEITYTQIESSLLIQKRIQNYSKAEKVTHIQKRYCYPLDLSLPLSSKYEIRVRAISDKNIIGEQAKRVFSTKPIKPKLISEIIGLERTNATQKIIIPPIKSETQTKASVCYIAVCDPTSTNDNLELPRLYNELYLLSSCKGKFWVAAGFNLTEQKNPGNKIEFIVGNGSTIENKPLKSDVNYTITVFLLNEYDNVFSNETYSFITSAPEKLTESNPALYLLLLLLLIIPIIGFFIYRKYRTPPKDQQLETTFEDTPVQNNNVPMRNLINNLTQYLPVRKNTVEQNEHDVPLMDNQTNENTVYSKPVKINDLSKYVKDNLENGELEKQHALFPKGGTKPWEYGMAKQNKFKNRYMNLTAYDHSRVILDKIPGDPFSDFINANYIDGYKQTKAYIATQGPKITTVNDFWRMVWQENVQCIIMLANLEEGNKKKCEKYWPEIGVPHEYHNVTVTFTHSDIYADFEFRYFEVRRKSEVRNIQQLHFTSWPDHGVPQYPQSLVPFLRKILTVPTTSPILVHCSAGVGRTGTIILADICLRMAAVEGQIDVLKYMHSIREQRAKLVDNFEQYRLVHMVLLECLLAPETSIPCANLAQDVQELFQQGKLQKQISYLKETAWHNQANFNMKIEAENMSKNRFPDIVPTTRRFYISRYPKDDEFSDYINAVPVDGFRCKDQFIVTQTPLPHTIKDFWRLVAENDVKVIVSLNEIIIDDKTCCTFWPLNKDEQSKPVPFLTLSCQSIQKEEKYDIYNINIENSKESTESSIRLMQVKNWRNDAKVPENIEALIAILEEAQNLSRNNPMVVSCYDGSTACGLFVALSFVIEKIKLEQICDVCQAVRSVRINRPQFVSHQVQFEFLYRAALQYVAQFGDYSNFEGPRSN